MLKVNVYAINQLLTFAGINVSINTLHLQRERLKFSYRSGGITNYQNFLKIRNILTAYYN